MYIENLLNNFDCRLLSILDLIAVGSRRECSTIFGSILRGRIFPIIHLRRAFSLQLVLVGHEVTQGAILTQHSRREFETLCLDLPKVLFCEQIYSLYDFKHRIGIARDNRSEHVERVDADVGALAGQTNQGVVKEHIEPLLVKFLLLLKKVGLARVHHFVAMKVLFELLHDLDS